MIGIYKITSPKGRIYIGQSVNIEKRFKNYKSLNCISQSKLYKSLIKYGYQNHTFEVIEECNIELLNERERYWQDYFNSVSAFHLNCLATKTNSKSGYMSDSSKLKMSKTRKGYKRPKDLIEKLRILNTGSKRSYESKQKMSIAQTGKKRSLESRKKQSEKLKGRSFSEETLAKMRNKKINSKKVQCLETGKIYDSLTIYCNEKNVVYKTIWMYLKLNKKNLKVKYYE